ncbi:hypothetical protein DFR86_03840 [Acidianus sulfidivorans JP7]|nr:hypothetical protein [Acidianus sulfidivorans]AWR96771.2 hypothetical protein DFR86_03840 [Acidianus sulfidivorans JP7]
MLTSLPYLSSKFPEKDYILALLLASIIGSEILSYPILSQFPRKEVDEIMRLIGVENVYFSKMISIIILSIPLFLLPIYIYSYFTGIQYNTFIVIQSLVSLFSLCFGIIGLFTLLNSKEAILTSIVLIDYILDLLYFNIYIYLLLLSIIITIVGYMKIKLKYL